MTSPNVAVHNETARGTAPSSVLVYVGLDRVGDGLLKLPFVRGLREAFPEAKITWFAGKETSAYASVLAPVVDGLLDEVVEYGGIGLTPWEVFRRPLPGRRFDMIFDTQRLFSTSLTLWRIPHKTFISAMGDFFLSSRKPPAGYVRPPSMQRELLNLLELAAGRPFATPTSLEIPIDDKLRADAARLLPSGPAYVGIAPGSGGRPKCWPLDRFIRLAQEQAEAGRVPVVLIGPGEREWETPFRAAVPEALFPLQADGIEAKHAFSPMFTIALSERFAASVSNDSGVGHMLAVGARPLISLFGTTKPEKFRPMTEALTIIRAADFDGSQMADIPYDAVSDALSGALSGAR